MSAITVTPPFPVFSDTTGKPLQSGFVYVGTSGMNAEASPISVFWDSELSIPALQPLRTINGYISRNGSPAQVYADAVDYSLLVKSKTNALIWSTLETSGISSGSSGVVYLPAGVGAVATTVESALRKNVHIRDFGGSPSASAATNSTALSLAITFAQSAGNAGVDIGPGGNWAFTAGVNWATRDIAIVGVGKPTLDFSAGTGKGFVLDAGGSGLTVRGMRVENFILKGGPNITDIFYSRGMVGSQFSNLEAREGTATGFSLNFSVLNTYKDLRVSNDSLGMTTTPAVYFKLDNDGSVGTRTQCNTFINCDASGKGATSTATGWLLLDATLCTWKGGTSESCAKGIDIAGAECRLNTFHNFDIEDNQVNDLILGGTSNVFNNCLFLSLTSGPNISNLTGKGTVFNGGYIRYVRLEAASSDTSFVGVGIDENLSGTIGIKGPGTYTAIGCTKIGPTGLVTGTLQDVLRNPLIQGDIQVTGQYVGMATPAGKPVHKETTNIVNITAAWTPLFNVGFCGFWAARDSTSGGMAFGTCDTGVPEVTVINNRIPSTVEFSLISGILNARTTAGTATRAIAVTATAIVGG